VKVRLGLVAAGTAVAAVWALGGPGEQAVEKAQFQTAADAQIDVWASGKNPDIHAFETDEFDSVSEAVGAAVTASQINGVDVQRAAGLTCLTVLFNGGEAVPGRDLYNQGLKQRKASKSVDRNKADASFLGAHKACETAGNTIQKDTFIAPILAAPKETPASTSSKK
jgi:hypothetical protein